MWLLAFFPKKRRAGAKNWQFFIGKTCRFMWGELRYEGDGRYYIALLCVDCFVEMLFVVNLVDAARDFTHPPLFRQYLHIKVVCTRRRSWCARRGAHRVGALHHFVSSQLLLWCCYACAAPHFVPRNWLLFLTYTQKTCTFTKESEKLKKNR